MLFDLTGKVAVVTGGNGGIGLGMATGLAKCGASIAVWARNEAKNAAAVETLRGHGVEAEAFVCDVTDERRVAEVTAATVERFGRIDVGIANAGAAGMVPNVLDVPIPEFRRIVDLNLTSVYITFQALGRQMVAQGEGGRLIAVASLGAILGIKNAPHYGAAKGGVCSLVRAFAVGLARYDIQVNAVLPGWVETEMTAPLQYDERFVTSTTKRTPARRWGKPEDFEAIAAYLASPGAQFHTGQILPIDGALSIG